MNEMSHQRLVLGCAGGGRVGKSSVYLTLTQQLILHPNHIISRGKPFHPSTLKYQSGEKGGGPVCVCVQGAYRRATHIYSHK